MNFYASTGFLPNSTPSDYEWDIMSGYNTDNLVAFATAQTPINLARILAIIAGKNYHFLNRAQCTIDFKPTRFQISVSASSRTISVSPPVNDASPPPDINPSGNLTFIAKRQVDGIEHESWGWGLSLVGDAFNTSIANFQPTQALSASTSAGTGKAPDNPTGIRNSVPAMIDNILIGYASAQLMVTHASALALRACRRARTSEVLYILAIFVVDTLVTLHLRLVSPCYGDACESSTAWILARLSLPRRRAVAILHSLRMCWSSTQFM